MLDAVPRPRKLRRVFNITRNTIGPAAIPVASRASVEMHQRRTHQSGDAIGTDSMQRLLTNLPNDQSRDAMKRSASVHAA
jgi:hypothetical protein